MVQLCGESQGPILGLVQAEVGPTLPKLSLGSLFPVRPRPNVAARIAIQDVQVVTAIVAT